MHHSAFEFVKRHATNDAIKVIEVGSRDVNGSVRPLFPSADYFGIDLHPGPGVDWVGDALDYDPRDVVDAVIIAEVLEHSLYWGELLHHVWPWLKDSGKLIITCAGPGRDPHSAIDGGELRDGEHYENITQDDLAEELHYAGFTGIEVSGNEYWKDTYAIAVKPESMVTAMQGG